MIIYFTPYHEPLPPSVNVVANIISLSLQFLNYKKGFICVTYSDLILKNQFSDLQQSFPGIFWYWVINLKYISYSEYGTLPYYWRYMYGPMYFIIG